MKAHDVRFLSYCSVCRELGSTKTVDGVDPLLNESERLVHARCLVATRGQAALLALPEVEIEKVRMCDVPVPLMKRLVAQSVERRAGRPTLDVSRQIEILEQAVRELKGGDSLTAEALVSIVHDALKSFHSGRPL